MGLVLALFGLPSTQSIVEAIVNFFFQDLARALVPDFLKNASVSTIKWLVALPDPTTWTHVGQLEGDMSYLAVSLLAVSFTAAIVRYLLVGLTGSGSPLQALSSTLASAAMIVGYQWAAHQAVAFVNTLTDSILSFPIVGQGLQRTVGVLFGGALLVGSGGVFLAVLVIVGVVFATVMFAFKVLLLIGIAFAYVSGLLVIAARPLPELSSLARAWASIVTTIALVPIGWTILFAVAGTLSLDATSFGTGGGLTSHIAGAFAALLTFYIAVKLPIAALSHLRSSFAGLGSFATPSDGSGRRGGFSRVADANARLQAHTLQAGRAVGLAAGSLGAPAGGILGAAGRATGRIGGRLAGSTSTVGRAIGGTASSAARPASHESAHGTSRGGVVRERIGRVARTLADAPRRARHVASRSTPPEHVPQDARDGGPHSVPVNRISSSPSHGGEASRARSGRGTSRLTPEEPSGDSQGARQPPRPPQRSAPAGEGNARASSATERGGAADRTPPSSRPRDVQRGAPVSRRPDPHVAPRAGGNARRTPPAGDTRAQPDGSSRTARDGSRDAPEGPRAGTSKPPKPASPDRQPPLRSPAQKRRAPVDGRRRSVRGTRVSRGAAPAPLRSASRLKWPFWRS